MWLAYSIFFLWTQDQGSSEQVTALEKRVAELEAEKGQLQLRLEDTEGRAKEASEQKADNGQVDQLKAELLEAMAQWEQSRQAQVGLEVRISELEELREGEFT